MMKMNQGTYHGVQRMSIKLRHPFTTSLVCSTVQSLECLYQMVGTLLTEWPESCALKDQDALSWLGTV